MAHLSAEATESRLATLADSTSELSSNISTHLAFKVLIHYNQARATTPDQNYALRPLRI